VTIVFYHDPSPETFAVHLAALAQTYNLISLRQFIEAHRAGRMSMLPTRSLIVSFDDGHAGNFELKPILEGMGVPVTIFLCSGIVGTGRSFWFKHAAGEVESLKHLPDEERLSRLRELGFSEASELSTAEALSSEEIEALAPVVDFQCHCVTHASLLHCSESKAQQEILGSKQQLERRYGFDIYALSYPNGDYSEREILLARGSEYWCALTADAGFNSQNTDPFRLKRICIDDNDGVDELIVKTCGLWGWIKGITRRATSGHVPRGHAPLETAYESKSPSASA
jgi:peptidoglycan/xylan/chitin deacetylase (PgdA/CDA1 family)